jgi:HAE1 family hydrophobic/amphiphilic exporter-1
MAEADRSTPDALLNLPLMTTKGTQIALSRVASIVDGTAPTQIKRENRERTITVGLSYLGRSQGAVQADAWTVVNETKLPPGVTIGVSGNTKLMNEMFIDLGIALGLALLFMYMILASQFGSFIHPFTIMMAVPFSVVGALIALFAFRFSFDMMAMIGLILLMGLVVKNSILLVEFINQLKRQGWSTREAILEAGPIRLRPILMTTLAMIFGMIPVAMGIGAGAEMRQAMAISVIGGLIVSTILTLVVVPVVYSILDSITRRLRRQPVVPAVVTVPITDVSIEAVSEEIK